MANSTDPVHTLDTVNETEKDHSVHQTAVEIPDLCPEEKARLEKLAQDFGSTWNGPDDPRDPHNWSSIRKISIAVIVSLGQLVTLMSASVMASALLEISEDLHSSSSTTQMFFSIYLLGLAFGPFFIAALSEIFGRRPVWLACNLWYCLWNALCPVGRSVGLMMVGRFLAGSGAAVGITLTGPVMADMYRAKDRGKSLAIATFIPYLGPALGPIVGGLVSQHVRWPWLFWILSIADATLVLVGFIFIRESYTPVLLTRQAETQHHAAPRSHQPFHKKLGLSLLRPVRLIVKRPIMQILAVAMAVNFGVYTLMLSTYATLWIDRYKESQTVSSLNYIAITIGATTAAQCGGYIMDYIYKRFLKRAGGVACPEFRAPYMAPTGIIIPAGLLWYGWSAQKGTSWVLVDFGAAIFAFGSFVIGQGVLAYILDEFKHTASANAAGRVLSNICGFAFPIFAPSLYSCLGYGWGNSLLALIYVVLVAPIPFYLWLWGPKLRSLGKKEDE